MHLSRCLGAHPKMWAVVPSRGELLVFCVFFAPEASGVSRASEASALGTVCPAFLFATSEKETEPERKGEVFKGTWVR
jgi:hypothetical protein